MRKFLLIFLLLAGCAQAQEYSTLSAYKAEAQKVFGQKLDFAVKQKKEFDVIFIIKQDGTIEQARMLKSAGKDLDKKIIAALGTVKLDPIPPEFEKPHIYYKFGFTPNTKSAAILRYEHDSQRFIMQHIPPAKSRKINEIWFNLTIERNGAVQNVKILKSSGQKKYDDEVVKTMQSLNFPHFGTDLKVETVEVPMRVLRR
jgi:TonB family protein